MTSPLVCGCILAVFLHAAISLSGANNIALNQPAIQRDTYLQSVASLAVDGDVNTLSCTTMSNVGAWWAVPLVRSHRVLGVKITADPSDYWAYRMDNFIVALSNTKPTVGQPLKEGSYTVCAQYKGRINPSVPVYVTCADFQPSFQYVIIKSTLSTANAICLAEVEVYAAPANVAFGRPAYQRTLYSNLVAARAVDAVPITSSCTLNQDVGAWWTVPLDKPVEIYGVRVTIPVDGFAYRTDNFIVGLTNIQPIIGKPIAENQYILCAQYKGRPPQGVPVYVKCARQERAFKWVFIMSSLTTADAICLQDVEVYGDDRYNYALNRNSFQLDTYSTALASKANDGNYLTVSCTLMNTLNPWWAVELTNAIHPTRIRVTNDNNPNFGYRLDNFLVWLSNVPPTVGQRADTTKFTKCAQYQGTVPLGLSVYVECPETEEKYKYVIIQGALTTINAICLMEVEIANDVFDPCESRPCKIGEICSKVDEMTHLCTLADPCASSPCKNGGVCSKVGDNGFSCSCAQGWTGSDCATADPCASSPCKNGGVCSKVGDNEFSCSCAQGWTGSDCATEVDPCSTSPCKNGGTCENTGNGDFSCSCVPGWDGEDCTTDVNVCKISNPCKNGGTCVKFGDSYTCKCAPSWAGNNCEIGSDACKAIDPGTRVNCGWGGITVDECSETSCCFDNTVKGVPWCFYSSFECELKATERADCGWPGITYYQCIGRGCCFDDDTSTNPGPVCFRKANPDCVGVEAADRVTQGDAGIQPNECNAQDWCYDSSVADASLWCFTKA